MNNSTPLPYFKGSYKKRGKRMSEFCPKVSRANFLRLIDGKIGTLFALCRNEHGDAYVEPFNKGVVKSHSNGFERVLENGEVSHLSFETGDTVYGKYGNYQIYNKHGGIKALYRFEG